MNGLDNQTLGPTRALAMARTEVTRCRNAYAERRNVLTLNAWTAALHRLHELEAQASEARDIARRREGDEEEPERWDLCN
jgi:hypothetical protein